MFGSRRWILNTCKVISLIAQLVSTILFSEGQLLQLSH